MTTATLPTPTDTHTGADLFHRATRTNLTAAFNGREWTTRCGLVRHGLRDVRWPRRGADSCVVCVALTPRLWRWSRG